MKILLLSYEFPPLGGGGGIVASTVVEQLAKEGHQIDVLTMGFKGLPRYEEKAGTRIYRVASLRKKQQTSSMFEQCIYLLMSLPRAFYLTKRYRYNLNYTHFIIPTGIGAYILKKLTGLPYVLTSHGSDVLGHNPRFNSYYSLVRPLWQAIVNSAARISVPSDCLGKTLWKVSTNHTDEKTMVIPNVINTLRFKPQNKQKKILVVSRLLPNKGVHNILDAIAMAKISNWEVNVVGDGPCAQNLQKQALSLGLKNVNFLGWLGNDTTQLRTIYGESAIFVSASHFESFGLTIIEALASGCAVIASDVGIMKNIIHNAGLLFDPNDKKMLCNQLLELTHDNELRRQMQEKACLRAARYDWSVQRENYLSFLGVKGQPIKKVHQFSRVTLS